MKKLLLALAIGLPLFAACNPQSGTTGGAGSSSSASTQSSSSSEVQVSSPAANSKITSPLVVTGKAQNNWFFEANIPVSLYDDQGNLLALAGGQALTDWMTQGWVDFKATLTFTTTASSGKLVIRKDNPSGLPENDGSFEIPVTF
jgi:hypothetical protein